MIVVQTKLKKIPERCTTCRFKQNLSVWAYGKTHTVCSITNKPIRPIFDKELNNWVQYRPDWCPLMEIE